MRAKGTNPGCTCAYIGIYLHCGRSDKVQAGQASGVGNPLEWVPGLKGITIAAT